MSKRLNLRDFQQNLSNRLQDKGHAENQVSTLGVQIGTQHWLVDMTDISEVLPLLKVTTLPLCKPWVVGMVNVRGNLYCVADLASFLGQGRVSGDMHNRLLLVSTQHDFNAALLIERVYGLRNIQAWRHDVVQNCYFDEQNIMWRKLDVPDLLGQAEFLQIGA
ncbi:MAG: chemotaxis protein CheW [Gallionella sp.]